METQKTGHGVLKLRAHAPKVMVLSLMEIILLIVHLVVFNYWVQIPKPICLLVIRINFMDGQACIPPRIMMKLKIIKFAFSL